MGQNTLKREAIRNGATEDCIWKGWRIWLMEARFCSIASLGKWPSSTYKKEARWLLLMEEWEAVRQIPTSEAAVNRMEMFLRRHHVLREWVQIEMRPMLSKSVHPTSRQIANDSFRPVRWESCEGGQGRTMMTQSCPKYRIGPAEGHKRMIQS
jgi:hypothetical protein